MGKKLAIKGHSTRGREVIELLEMMGGNNRWDASGKLPNLYYFISNECIIYSSQIEKDVVIFTLEEFLEKYPYKVGDKVKDCYKESFTIDAMSWSNDCETMVYTFEESDAVLTAEDLLKWTKKEGMEEKKINQMSLANCDLDEVEIVLGDKFELKIKDGKYYAVRKKPKYPTTYAECCMILQDACMTHKGGYKGNLMQTFQKLLICREAYWKIAGEEMGLDKPWEPVYKSLEDNHYFTICTFNGEIDKSATSHRNTILAFPTKEMRDAFYENFKDLIEQSKELL